MLSLSLFVCCLYLQLKIKHEALAWQKRVTIIRLTPKYFLPNNTCRLSMLCRALACAFSFLLCVEDIDSISVSTLTMRMGLRSMPARPWPFRNGGSSSTSSISISSSVTNTTTVMTFGQILNHRISCKVSTTASLYYIKLTGLTPE